MIWNVADDGHIIVRLRATGSAASMLNRVRAERYVNRIVEDLANSGVTVATHDIMMNPKAGEETTDVLWHAHVPPEQVLDIRAYLDRLALSSAGR